MFARLIGVEPHNANFRPTRVIGRSNTRRDETFVELTLLEALGNTLRYSPLVVPAFESSSSVSTTPESRGLYFLGRTLIVCFLGDGVFSVMLNTKEEFGSPLKSRSSMSPESSADRDVSLGRPDGEDDCAGGDRCCVMSLRDNDPVPGLA
jgi:hypothetical protein